MALIYLDGFDGMTTVTGNSSATDTRKYIESRIATLPWSGVNNPQTGTGRTGGYALGAGVDTLTGLNGYFFGLPDEPQTIIIGFWLWVNRNEGYAAYELLNFKQMKTSRQHIVMKVTQGSHIYVTRGTSIYLGTAVNALRQESWNFVEAKVKIANSPDGTVEIRVNCNTVLDLSGIDTNESGIDDTMDAITLRGQNGESATDNRLMKFDDLYICDTTGSSNNDFLGLITIESLFPTAAGDSTGWTPNAGLNWDNVNEVSFDTTTYNEASTATTKDLFTCGSLDTITNVLGVDVSNVVKVTKPQAKSLKNKVKSSTTEGTGSAQTSVETSVFTTMSGIFENNPHTAIAWTPSEVNAMQIGYEVG